MMKKKKRNKGNKLSNLNTQTNQFNYDVENHRWYREGKQRMVIHSFL